VHVLPDSRADQALSLRPHLTVADNTDEVLREKSIAYLKELVAKVLNLPSTEINVAEPLTNYGLDSLLVLQLTNTLRTSMKQVSITLFYEYPTIDALVEHLLHTQKEALEHLVGVSMPARRQEQAVGTRLTSIEDMLSLN
jgi:aryl carrier-like protein